MLTINLLRSKFIQRAVLLGICWVLGAATLLQAQSTCTATFGRLGNVQICVNGNTASVQAEAVMAPTVPQGFEVLYVLTKGPRLVIQQVSPFPFFRVTPDSAYTIHTLVYNPATLDLSIVRPGVTTGFDVNSLLIQGGGRICAALDVAGAKFNFGACTEPCFARAGRLRATTPACIDGAPVVLRAEVAERPVVPQGYIVRYVLTRSDSLVILGVSATPQFTVTRPANYTIHTLVYDSTTLNLGIVRPGVTTGFNVNSLLVQGGGSICAALDVAGAKFNVTRCPCTAAAGTLRPNAACLENSKATLTATRMMNPVVPTGYQIGYVLTRSDSLVIIGVNSTPSFTVDRVGRFRIHTLVYNPATLDLSIVRPGVTTGVDVNRLLIQGGGSICAALDVAGAIFDLKNCPCAAKAGTLAPANFACLEGGKATLRANVATRPVIPAGFEQLYVLTRGDSLVIEQVGANPTFEVTKTGKFTIHSLVFDPKTLDLSIVTLGKTTGFDVNGLLEQGGGNICASLDVAGAKFTVNNCACLATAGILRPIAGICLNDGSATLRANFALRPFVPTGYQVLYVLTRSDSLVIIGVNSTPSFVVNREARYRIHTLVYNPATLDLSIVRPGVTTGFDVNRLLVQGGGSICAALDVAGARFDLKTCPCAATAGTLAPAATACLDNGKATLTARVVNNPVIPQGFSRLYVLTSGSGLVIQGVSSTPAFNVTATGAYTIHTLVYDPKTLDLGIVDLGKTTGFDVNGLLIQGGGRICGALDVAGAKFNVAVCACTASAGTLRNNPAGCLETGGKVTLRALPFHRPHVPTGFSVLYVLTSGTGLVIEQVNAEPSFQVDRTGRFTIHTLVYDPKTLDLSIVQLGKTTGFDVNGLLIQGGGRICGALDVAGAVFNVAACPCLAKAGTLRAVTPECSTGRAHLRANIATEPVIPHGFLRLYVLTRGDGLVIEQVNVLPQFTVNGIGRYRIHTLVYNPFTLNLGIVQFGKTTGFDVNSLLIQGGGRICGALDVAGAVFDVRTCGSVGQAGASSVFPNPTTGQLNLLLDPSAAATNGVQVEILDLNGKIYRSAKLDAGATQGELNVAELPAGMYLVRLNYGSAKGEMLRFNKL